MRKSIAMLVFLLFGTHVAAQLTPAHKDSLQSEILGEQRDLLIKLPEAYDQSDRYPVLYLLDGEHTLYAAAAVAHQLANQFMPSVIVVGIPNTDRERDMTPFEPMPEPPFTDGVQFSEAAGGGKNFVAFLEQELIPYIDRQYATADYRIIAGHSMSGLLSAYASIFHPQTFDAGIAIDPAAWWARGRIVEEVSNAGPFQGNKIYIGMSNSLEGDVSFETVLQDTTYLGNISIQRILKLANRLQSGSFEGLEARSKFYPDEVHMSMPLITLYDGLRFIFEAYPNFELLFDYPSFMSDPAAMQAKMEETYRAATDSFGFTVTPPEYTTNFLGYECLRLEKPEVAVKYFAMNVHFFPNSPYAHDALGDGYAALGKKDKAIAEYKKALSIEERAETREKLEDLEGEK